MKPPILKRKLNADPIGKKLLEQPVRADWKNIEAYDEKFLLSEIEHRIHQLIQEERITYAKRLTKILHCICYKFTYTDVKLLVEEMQRGH